MVKLVSSSAALFFALASTCMAQTTSAPTTTAVTPPTPTGSQVDLPILLVYSPQNNTVVHQGQALSIMATFENKRSIISMTASVSKLDGTGNQTVAMSTIPNMLRSFAWWNISSDFPLGAYKMDIQVKPMLVLPAIPGQLAPTTLPPMAPVYYWNGVVQMQTALPSATPTAGSSGSTGGKGSTSAGSSLLKISGAATSMLALAAGGAFLWT
ncbi:hypothetical protein EMPS_06709 [Entomortierella parvispora]|uniref:Uncharacterized protein n=1 Tax=Entomortierella parvispora TaxID=205924 RepID=A0A9P3LXH6_9FUNG|nr:hypothetical protein EMPS_06709 [Entomortierella parvispora]